MATLIVYTSNYATLALADAAAVAAGGALVIDSNPPALGANTTLSSKEVSSGGGKITLAGYVLSILGTPSIGPIQWLDRSGGGSLQLGSSPTSFWNDPIVAVYPEWFGALGGSNDDTSAVQAAIDTHGPVKFAQDYNVSRIDLIGNELNIDGNNFYLIGVASSPTNSVLDIRCGYSLLRNLRVDGNFNGFYTCAVQIYTNNQNANNPGFNRIDNLYIRYAYIGVLVGAPPMQPALSPSALTGQTHSNTTVDNLSANPISSGWYVGMGIKGTGIPAFSWITALTSTSITISQTATASAVGVTLQPQFQPPDPAILTGDTNSNTTISSLSASPIASGWYVGMGIAGHGLPVSATVTALTSTSATISAAAASTNTGVEFHSPIQLPQSAAGITHSNTTIDGFSADPQSLGWYVGMGLDGNGIPGGTTITAFPNASSVTISNAATSTSSPSTVEIFPFLPLGFAVNAPVSETYIHGLLTYGCLTGVWMRQPNGKITISDSVITGSINELAGLSPYNPAVVRAIALRASSELNVIGGSIEQQPTSAGKLVDVQGVANLFVESACIESSSSSYIAHQGKVTLSHIANFGFNYSGAPFQVHEGAIGRLLVEGTVLVRGPGYASSGTSSIVEAVDGYAGTKSAALGFACAFSNVEFRDAAFRSGTSLYVPLVRGLKCSLSKCRLSSYDATGLIRSIDLILDDGPDLLRDKVDQTAATITAYPTGTNNTLVGGWYFTNGGGGGRWGSESNDLPPVQDESSSVIMDETLSAALRLAGNGGGGFAAAQTPFSGSGLTPIRVSPEKLLIFRCYLKPSATGSSHILIRANWYDFSGSALPNPYTSTNLYYGVDNGDFLTTWQPIMLLVQPPSGCSAMDVFLYAEVSAELYVANPTLK